MGISDKELADFSDFSYIDIPLRLRAKLEANGSLSIKELADYYLSDKNPGKFKCDDIQDQRIISILKECQNGAYSDYEIINYDNKNDGDGFVGYAIKTPDDEIIIASRGSEMPYGKEDEIPDSVIGNEPTWEDWIDNFKISIQGETAQQASAKEFLKVVGENGYKEIYITGHSKGGNNALYMVVTADSELLEYIKKCVTFNAPGFNDEFIKNNKESIEKLLSGGKVIEYQGKGDFVSALMNNIGIIKVVEQIQWDNKGLIDDHFIYAMLLNGDKTDFIIDGSGRKDLIPNVVNKLVSKLLNTLSEDEINNVIGLIEELMSSEDFSLENIEELLKKSGISVSEAVLDRISLLNELGPFSQLSLKDKLKVIKEFIGLPKELYELLKESDVSKNTTDIIILQTVVSSFVECFKEEIAIKSEYYVELAKNFLTNTKDFIVNNLNKAKTCIIKGFARLKGKIVTLGKDAIRNILGGPLNVRLTTFNGFNSMAALGNMIYNGITDKRFIVKPEDLESALKIYKNEYANVISYKNEVQSTVMKLASYGWNGQGAQMFINVRLVMYMEAIEKCKTQLNDNIAYLNKGISLFKARENEEKQLANIL